ncbi:unnamed protein product [Adineta steineri]|uniref:sn-1-specific diacylglycerol lipase n=1 Tax=Adineta steineri TaxID=433720 RepID=A0A813VIL3_9BILA|nr:unnamed protein product [Adineta steineri]
MPSIHLFNRRFNFASDDLTLPSLIDIILRFPLLIIFIIYHLNDKLSNSICSSSFYIGYFYPLLIIYIGIIIISSIICFVSLQGTPVNNIYPRRHMSLLIYIRLIFVLIDIIINIIGLIIILKSFEICEFLSRRIMILSIIISAILAISLFIILAIFIDLTGVVSAEKKWEMRIKFIFSCGRSYGGQSSDIQNIVKTLQYLFDDERFDLVASDVATGLILLQQEDLLEERSIDIIESAPLNIVQEGLYYNSYAQSAFGWFSLAYQYRMTFIPRILFAMRYRTIGLCCCCCGLTCCQNPDSLYDPCGSQYTTLQYLLRKQKPIILYANFFGAFGRAPFYIAADNEKKTIIISIPYQYRMTFIPRILFAMRYRTIGLCCCCCGLTCCQNPDSLYDPCGSQYKTLQYLLRKQKPIILYANFFGAFGRAPFYIAADNEKKTIIISIRGTLSAMDILTDINAVEDILETELFGNGHCHSGMHSAAKYIHNDISTRLVDIFVKYPDYTLVICGYSLGAGVAAILSILFKSTYPHVKCYGIAMPGSVLSENLALATRDFIYSYVVDVDMIARASIHSLKHLRDRIIDALNKCNRNKLRVLTTTFIRTLTKRRLVFHSMMSESTLTNTSLDMNSTISQIVSTDHSSEYERLIIPGTIIHLYSTDRVGLFTRKASYRACISTYNQFTQFIVHPRMWFDHFPASYSTALADVIENLNNSSTV